MEIVFLEAKKKLIKQITPEGTTPYPLVKNFTSHHFNFGKTQKGLEDFFNHLQSAAAAGMCLHKGLLKRPLEDETRALLADRNAPTELLIIDIDGLQVPNPGTDVKTIAEKFLLHLPDAFQNVSYIAQASASLGLKPDRVSLHLFFFLRNAVHPKTLKEWLKLLNYETDILADQLSLSANGQSVSYVLDPSLAENSKLVYLAPPKFVNIKDPIPNNRFVFVKGSTPTLNLELNHVNPERVHNLGVQIKDGLRKKLSLPKKAERITTVMVSGERHDVLQNPDKMTIEIARVSEPFVNCNVNGGDSNGYYFLLTNPHFMYNFKGEPIWEIQKADPDFYKSIFEVFADKIDGDQKVQPIVLRDFYTDTYFNGIFDENKQQFTEDFPLTPTQKSSLEDFMRTHNRVMPDFIPDAQVVFDPSNEKGIELEQAPYYVNLYRRTKYMLEAKEAITLEYGTAKKLKSRTPNIYNLISHILGDGETEFEHFINWLAYIYQNKRKTMTAWIFTGVPGTGKGLFVHKILKPLFGESQVPMRSLENIEEQFNLYMRTALFLVVDEFRMSDSGNTNKMADKLKHQVTEPTLTIRAMRTNQIELPSFCNFIFLTNRGDAVKIEEGDRRYNVGPRQEKKLEHVHPDLLLRFENIAQDELFYFAGALQSFKVDVRMAHTALENEAKQQMKEVSMSVLEEFAHAIKQASLEYFSDILDIEITNTFDAGGIASAQRYVKDWIAKAGEEIVIPMQHLKVVYDVLTDSRNKLSQRDFSKAMSRLNVITRRKRVTSNRNASIPRGVVLTWKLDDNVKEQLVKDYFEDKDLVLLKQSTK